VREVAGEDVIALANFLRNKSNVSEFKLAESMKQEVNATRNMLYRLYESSLVSYIRRKDKKKGWYIYYWTFNVKRIKFLLDKLKKARYEKLRFRLEREQANTFFSCDNLCMRLEFEQATNFDYKCPECGELMHQEDNTQRKKLIEKEMKTIEKELKLPKKKA